MRRDGTLNPHDPEDRYCYFCKKQYRFFKTFKEHVLKEHGLAIAWNIHLIDSEEWMGLRYMYE